MLDCWQQERADRPKFSAIVKVLDKFKLFPELLIPVAAPRYVGVPRVSNSGLGKLKLVYAQAYMTGRFGRPK